MQNYSTIKNDVKKWPMEPESESESDMKNEVDLSGPTLIEDTSQIPTIIQQRKKQRIEDGQSLQDG